MNTQSSAPSTWLQLPLTFDVARMRQESAQFAASDWIAHFNARAYEQGWSCVPLRSAGGEAGHIIPLDGAQYSDTPHLARCPYLRDVIASFQCGTSSVRLMSLAPGAIIHAHRDAGTALMDGLTRIHIPIQTSPQVLFSIDGESVHFTAGHAWYMDASCLHAVENRGTSPRIHLVVDCLTNEWLENLFARAGFVPKTGAKYGDPSINEGNVQAVIAQLRSSPAPAMHAMADRLATLTQGTDT
ncbi:aspartyl/asparaginyl beta-hydroxylase domain-containing protein [Janthinobacterium sp.]|uniref:aspartyl/asparaginyl beta-hydroxylase domain-containing protein n=1 Tax=Janthinobacterium sp. TaxID=1871054 RepID=UPI00260F5C1F|nr:aspartyl/asparaginyl beta-hydroxylase domain-containing protein [Janthinobacterium sp.]